MQQHSWSASPKDGEDASHQFSWDEGEFHHAGPWHDANVSRKHDHSCGAHDEEWNWDEHRGANHGFAYDSHQDCSGQHPDCNWDQDELDGQNIEDTMIMAHQPMPIAIGKNNILFWSF